MSTGDTTARNSRATNFSSDYTGATLAFMEGATVLATHTFAGYSAPVTGVITANSVPDVIIDNSGVCDSAIFSDVAGSYTLTVGNGTEDPAPDIIRSTLTFTAGETSKVDSALIDFPA